MAHLGKQVEPGFNKLSSFTSEFPLKSSISAHELERLFVEWLRGHASSTLLSENDSFKKFDDELFAESRSGEKVTFKRFDTGDGFAVGFRHEISDDSNRIWRTDCILTNREAVGAFIRVRGQCVAAIPGADLITPKKPYLVKMMLRDGWGSEAGLFPISDEPITADNTQIQALSEAIRVGANIDMPLIYVSRLDDGKTILDCRKLAYDLGGLAHVVEEPSRAFSFSLAEATGHANPYGGTIGYCEPGTGILRKLHKRSDFDTPVRISCSIQNSCIAYNNRRARLDVLDWAGLQEIHARKLRDRLDEGDAKNLDEYIEAFDTELSAKDERIYELELSIEELRTQFHAPPDPEEGLVPAALAGDAISELYPGEVSDRVREVLVQYANEKFSKHKRTTAVVKKLLLKSGFTGRAVSLTSQIKAAGRDSSKMASSLTSMLVGFGFKKEQEGKHIKCSPPPSSGLEIEILPKTPSDHRAGRNKASEIINHFGLKELK